MLTRARSESGFTLIELLVAISLGMVVIIALLTLIDTSGSARARLTDKTETVQRMRIGMDRIVRVLRTQVCASTTAPPIISGDADAVTFYSDTSTTGSNGAFRPRKVALYYSSAEAGPWCRTPMCPRTPRARGPTTPSPSTRRTLIDNIAGAAGGSVDLQVLRLQRSGQPDHQPAAGHDAVFQHGRGELGGQGHQDRRRPDRPPAERQHGRRTQHHAYEHGADAQLRLLGRRQRRPLMGAPMRLITTLKRRLARQEGFTMPAVMAGMFVVMLIGIAAIASASGDINLARDDQDDKQAFAAAEAGINDYLGNLNTDTNFWAKCTTGCRRLAGEPEGRDQRHAQVARRARLRQLRVLDRADPRPGLQRVQHHQRRGQHGRRRQHQGPLDRSRGEEPPRDRDRGQRRAHRDGHLPPRRASWTSSTTPTSRTRTPPTSSARGGPAAAGPRTAAVIPFPGARTWRSGARTSASGTGGGPRQVERAVGRSRPGAGSTSTTTTSIARRRTRTTGPTPPTPTTSVARSRSSRATRSTARSTPTTRSWSAARPRSEP